MAEQSTESTDSARTETVKAYVSETTKQDLDREADRRDLSRSALIAHYIQRGLRQDREDDLAAESDAARRLGDVLDAGLDDFRDTARHIQDLNAKTGVYAVAAFELLKQSHGEAEVREALQTGSRRLRADEPPERAADRDESAPASDTADSSLADRLRRGDDG